MQCLKCRKAELAHDVRDVEHTHNGQTVTLKGIAGLYCPACGDLVMNIAQSGEYWKQIALTLRGQRQRVERQAFDPDAPFMLMATITLEDQHREMNLRPSKSVAIAQIGMVGEILPSGIAFTEMHAATDDHVPAAMLMAIENILPMMGQSMRGTRSGELTPDNKEQRIYDLATGERLNRNKLDS